MKLKTTFAITTVTLALALSASFAEAGSCRNAIKSLQQQIFGTSLNDRCANLNMEVGENSSQFLYTNPDAGCDLGLSLPGLPNFGFGLDGAIDMCGLAKMVTGSTIKAINTETRGAMNEAIGAINQQSQATLGTNTANTNVDVADVVMDRLKQSGVTVPSN